tara:strand:+ start:384 stop:596 length:213 start_codon:yes stop_codon:yes gene_type:complete
VITFKKKGLLLCTLCAIYLSSKAQDLTINRVWSFPVSKENNNQKNHHRIKSIKKASLKSERLFYIGLMFS